MHQTFLPLRHTTMDLITFFVLGAVLFHFFLALAYLLAKLMYSRNQENNTHPSIARKAGLLELEKDERKLVLDYLFQPKVRKF